jgi:hypothetical protein
MIRLSIAMTALFWLGCSTTPADVAEQSYAQGRKIKPGKLGDSCSVGHRCVAGLECLQDCPHNRVCENNAWTCRKPLKKIGEICASDNECPFGSDCLSPCPVGHECETPTVCTPLESGADND